MTKLIARLLRRTADRLDPPPAAAIPAPLGGQTYTTSWAGTTVSPVWTWKTP